MIRQSLSTVVVAFGGMFLAAGCVPQAEHDAQVMANRKLREERELAMIELQEARSQAELARARWETIENELGTKSELIANLVEERDRHLEAFRRAQTALEELASRKPQDPVVLTQALPPELDTALRDFAGNHPDSVDYDSQRGIVKWKSDLLFALGSDVVMNSAKDSLKEFAEIMNTPAAAPFDVTVVGHTDDTRIAKPQTRRNHPTNWHLSAHRAIAVMNVLSEYGVTENRMGIMGYGEFRPLAPNESAETKSKNRRVEIYVVPRNTVALVDAAVEVPQDAGGKVEVFRPVEEAPSDK